MSKGDWVTTAHVFCDRLGIKQKADALHIVNGINALTKQNQSLKQQLAEREKECERLIGFIDTLRDMTKVQCSDGNWNCNEYMHGMANGLIFALSIFDNCEPEYLDAPNLWLDDIDTVEEKAIKEE